MKPSDKRRSLQGICRVFSVLICSVLLASLLGVTAWAEGTETTPEFIEVRGQIRDGYRQDFVYSDSILLEDATAGVYPEMVKVSVSLAAAAYEASYVSSMLDQMGYSTETCWYTERNINYNDLVAYALGMKTLPGTGKKAFIVAVRGTGPNSEWFSDFNVGATESGDHRGFHLAAEDVWDTITSAIKTTPYEDRIILITGHSRGAAVANIVAAKLLKGGYVKDSQIFAYTFACPNVSRTYDTSLNIHNFNNNGDMVPVIPLKDWGYGRNGQTHNFNVPKNLYKALTGREYAGATVATVYEDAFKQIAPTAESLEEPLREFLIMSAAFVLGGCNDTKMEEVAAKYLQKNGTTLLDEFLKKITGVSDYESAVEEALVVFKNSMMLAEQLHTDTEGMTQEEFEAYQEKNKDIYDDLMGVTGVIIADITDVPIVIEILLRAIQYADEAGSIGGDLFAILEDTGMKSPLQSMDDAHRENAYVFWANYEHYGYKGRITADRNIRIPDDVLTISPSCFEYSSISSFSANNLMWISDNCFYGASKLETVVIPDTVTHIGSSAFVNCSALKDITLPIEQSVVGKFLGCSNVETITYTAQGDGVMPARGTYSSNDRDHYNKTLEYVCRDSVKKIVYGEGVTEIASYANYHNWETSQLTELVLPSTLKRIGSCAFYGTALPSLALPEGVETIYANAFDGSHKMTTLSIPSTVVTMRSHAFANSPSLKEITFGNAVIGANCFEGCTGLETLVIPNNITSIDNYAFNNCTGLKEVTLPIEQTKPSVFTGCSNVETITYTAQGNGVMPARGTYSSNDRDHYTKTLEYVCRDSVKKIVYGEGVTEIASYANYHNWETSQLTELVLPSTLKRIGIYAFYATTLPSLALPEGVETIYAHAFDGSHKMTTLSIPSTVVTMGSHAFANSPSLKEITFGNAVIGANCFEGCTGLETLVIPNNITSIDNYAFNNCTGLKEVTLPIEQTKPSVFMGCSNVETITYTAQGNGVMPARGTYSSNDRDHYTKTLEYVCRDSVKKIVYGEGVTTIASYANYHDSAKSQLTEMVFPATIQMIGTNAFYGCGNMTEITFEHHADDALTIYGSAFYVGEGTDTNVFVSSLNNIHPAISGYNWSGNNRSVTFGYIPVVVESIVIRVGDAAIEKNVPALLTVEVVPETIAADQILWTVDREDVAAITPQGEVTFARAGYATVRAAVANSEAFAEVVLECEGDMVLSLPGMLKTIEAEAFIGIPAEIVMIPDGAQSIGAQAFADCPNLYKVVIPDTVIQIEAGAFADSEYVTICADAQSYAAQYAQEAGVNFMPTQTVQ